MPSQPLQVSEARKRLSALVERVARGGPAVAIGRYVRCEYCMPYENDLPVHIARGLKAPLAELWQRLKRFI